MACLLPLGTPLAEIPERLKLYEQCRYTRASQIQEYSRLAGKDIGDGPPLDTSRYTDENFGYDEWHNSTQKLREWKWSRAPKAYRRMPVAFGPLPGPRQDHLGNARDWTQSTFSTASIKIKTSRTLLRGLLPPQFKFVSADSVCFATFSLSSLGNLEWLGGNGYAHFGLYIHGVESIKSNGDKVTGTYLPVLFENLADPIISGREELGMPKVYSSLDVTREGDSLHLRAGWMGNKFLDFSLTGLGEETLPAEVQHPGGPPPVKEAGLLLHKQIPTTASKDAQGRGQSDADYVVFLANEDEAKAPREVERTLVAKGSEIKFDALDWQKLPTLHHIIERLQEIPIYEVVDAKLVEGRGGSDVRSASRLI